MIKCIFIIILLFYSCSAREYYMDNRASDFGDMFTLGLEQRTFGASAYLWCAGGGLEVSYWGEGFGLRNGHLGTYRTGGTKAINSEEYTSSRKGRQKPIPGGLSFLVFNTMEHKPKGTKEYRNRKKRYIHSNVGLFVPQNCHAPLTFEFSMGLFYGFRIGFNFSEFLDFHLGILGIDIMEDDRSRKTDSEEQEILELKEKSHQEKEKMEKVRSE